MHTNIWLSAASLSLTPGKFYNSVNDSICPMCNQEIETEEHVLTQCPTYMIFRNELYTASSDINDVFIHINDCDKMCFILNDPNLCRLSSKICYTMLYHRRPLLYNR